MATVCPQCHQSFEGLSSCPHCDRKALPFAEAPAARTGSALFAPVIQFHRTAEGCLLISLAVTALLSYGLFLLATTSLQAFDTENAESTLTPETKQWLFFGLQLMALLMGTVLAGVGHRRGLLFGGLVGAVTGLVFVWSLIVGLAAEHFPPLGGALLTPGSASYQMTLLVMPLIHTSVGALGGLAGSRIWKPLPELSLATFRSSKPGLRPGWHPRRLDLAVGASAFSGPISWPRVVVGTVVAALGGGWTDRIIDGLLAFSEGELKVTTDQDNLMAYLIVFAFSILLGGFVAGANKSNGIKQGLCVGIGASFLLAGLYWNGAANQSVSVIYPIVGTICLGPIGGWFGGELLPPAAKRDWRRLGPKAL
jgi:hypothetical protein